MTDTTTPATSLASSSPPSILTMPTSQQHQLVKKN